MPNTLVALLAENSILLVGVDLLAKSTVVLLFTLLVSRLVKAESFGSRSQHLLWLTGLTCVALVPLVSAIPGFLSIEPRFQAAILTLPAPINSGAISQAGFFSSFSFNSLLTLAYLAPCLLLLSRMVFAVVSVFSIGSRALANTNRQTLDVAKKVAKKLDVSRPFRILQSEKVTSPFSFGIFTPKIVLPNQANDWSESTLEDVLVHEFTHIKRLDWPSTLLCHFIASLYWINPLCWMAINRISEEAENSCDAAVVNSGKDSADYAKNLMLIARQSRDGNRLLTQMMAGNCMLPKRVRRILQGKANTKVNKTFLPIFTAVLFSLVIVFGNMQVLALASPRLIISDPAGSTTPSPTFVATPRFGLF